MTTGTDNPDDGRDATPRPPDEREQQDDSQSARFAVPGWARPGGDPARRRGWRGWRNVPRWRLVWPVAVILLLFAVWSNYPFVPNPWVALFRQPGGDASALSTPQQWAMYGANPTLNNFIPQADAPEGVVAFTVAVDGEVRSAPAVDETALYIGGQSRIAAYSTDTGEMLWERPVNGPAHGVPAATGGESGLVYLGTLGTNILALDPASGQTVWEYDGDSPFPGAVTVQDGILYAASRGGHVHALDAATGNLLWKMDAGDPVVAPVAIGDGKMFAASTGGVLYIRDSRTGDKRARIRTGGALVAPPVVDGQRLYLLSGGDLLAFEAGIRETPFRYPAELIWAQMWIWGFPLPPPPEHAGLLWRVSPEGCEGDFIHPPAVTPEALYLGTDDGCVLALDPEGGSELWQIPPASELRRVDGNLWWRMSIVGDVAAPLLAAGDLLLVAHKDGSLRAINRFSREEAWSLSLSSPLVAPLSYADGAVYAHTEDGRLHAIR